MKKSLAYEIAAAVSAIFGAFLLVGVYMPLLNPEQTRIETHRELPSVGYYLVVTPIPLLILVASWHFNKKARATRQESEESARISESAWERRLKLILGAIVIVLVLIAFLW
jgi:heme/copper-type cytochrome/quinol oxidase subunit 2